MALRGSIKASRTGLGLGFGLGRGARGAVVCKVAQVRRICDGGAGRCGKGAGKVRKGAAHAAHGSSTLHIARLTHPHCTPPALHQTTGCTCSAPLQRRGSPTQLARRVARTSYSLASAPLTSGRLSSTGTCGHTVRWLSPDHKAACGPTVRVTRYVRHARGGYAYSVRTVERELRELPCAAGTYSTQEAGTRSPYSTVRRLEDVRVNPGWDVQTEHELHVARGRAVTCDTEGRGRH